MKTWIGPLAIVWTATMSASLGIQPALAQALDVRYDPIGKTVNLDADNADVRLIVPKLLNAANITQYRMDPSINAKVTLSLRNKPFSLALQTVLARAGAEYDYDRGVLRIFRVAERPEPGRSPGGALPPAFLAPVALRANDVPLTGVMANLSRMTGVAVRSTNQVPRDLRVSVVADNETLWRVLQRIAQTSRLRVDITGEREATFSPLTSTPPHEGEGGACRRCRYELRREWKYCPMCGERINR